MNTQNAIQEISEEIFSVVKEKVDAKVDKADIGYFEIDATQIQTEPPTVTLTSSQLLEVNKKYCVVKIFANAVVFYVYKSLMLEESSNDLIYFYTLPLTAVTTNVVQKQGIEMVVNIDTGVATLGDKVEEYYTTTGADAKFQTKSNLRTSFQSTPDDTHYPSEKLVKDNLDSINGKIPSEASSSNKLADKDWTNTQLGTKQPNITSSNKLSSSLVDDTSSNNKFVPPYTEETFTFVLKSGGSVTKTFFVKVESNNN